MGMSSLGIYFLSSNIFFIFYSVSACRVALSFSLVFPVRACMMGEIDCIYTPIY